MKETTLIRMKARRMSAGELIKEIQRIDAAIRVTARPREIPRYKTRRAIMRRELERRSGWR